MTSPILASLQGIEPSLPAIDDGSLRLSYGDVQRYVAQEQRWLKANGVRRCGLLAENSARWIVSDLALLACEAVNVPLPAYFTTAQVRHVLDDAAIESVLTYDAERFVADHPAFVRLATSNRTGLTLLQRWTPTPEALSPGVSKVTYTSGSTGTPKGACLSAAAIASVTQSLVAVTASLGIDKHLCLLPLPTLLENIAGVYVPLVLGAQICVKPSAEIGMSYSGLNVPLLLRAISSTAPQSLILVPELLRVLLQATHNGWHAPASLKFIAVGGASLSIELLNQARQAQLPVFQGYGLSECASVVCLNTPTHNRLGSVGRPLPHARVRIDSSGEICVAGATMSGYLGDEQVSDAEVRTGDLGEIDAEGFVYVSGRAKNMFITSMGRNVAPEWVEGELTSEPAIVQALVAGEAKPNLVALIVGTANTPTRAIEEAVIRANARLPDYARVRRWTAFPEPPSISNGLLTANGRMRRAEIISRHGALLDSLYDYDYEDDAHEFS